MTLLLLEVEAERESYRIASKPVPEDKKVLLQSVEQEARNLAIQLKDRLRADPTAWREILPLLASFGQAKNPLKVMAMIADVVDESGEAYFADVLAQGDSNLRNARRLAVVALKVRETPGSLTSLMEAARQDPTAIVRYESLQALRTRHYRAGADNPDPTILEFIRGRAQADPDEQVRKLAHRLTPEGAPKPPAVRKDRGFKAKRPKLPIRKPTPKNPDR